MGQSLFFGTNTSRVRAGNQAMVRAGITKSSQRDAHCSMNLEYVLRGM
jgi:hypothetical protein